MRIPLDYYRILGVPLQATADQLQQAHRDRMMQLPRREYSEMAIASRKTLLDRAYSVLSDPQTKREYAQKHALEFSPSGDRNSQESLPFLEIEDSQLLGVLPILLELGEYELVLSLGQDYLDTLPPPEGQGEDYAIPELSRADVVLTLALAGLELGREQWQQGTYKDAALSLEQAEKLLLNEGVFPSLRGELQTDLYKLRPYRILELLSEDEDNALERRQGIQMLRDMLQERGGLDGNGDDRSGLNVDDFLRFIQQLRGYLTSLEQQTLFETEAQRNSAVATYLSVYALLVRGFAYQQPASINRAKRMLMRLGSRQDVHLEQAVCCLLLGQTEEASRALELSQEYEQLAFIRENSQGAPDLLPGLCLYSERWLHEEVFPHFRDLKECKQTLKEYFADDGVQTYLENLPLERGEPTQRGRISRRSSTDTSAQPTALRGRTNTSVNLHKSETGEGSGGRGTATLTRSELKATAPTQATSQTSSKTLSPTPSLRSLNSPPKPPLGRTGERSPSLSQRSPSGKPSLHWGRLLLLAGGALLGLGIIIWAMGQLLALVGSVFSNKPTLDGEHLQLMLNQPPIEIPEAKPQAAAPTGPLNEAVAARAIATWLEVKAEGFGSEYKTDRLPVILTEPALSTQQRRIEQNKVDNVYGEYEHSVEVQELNVESEDADRAIAEALVTESVNFYRNGELDRSASYSDTINVSYQLVREDGQWRIQDW
ncbi:IMS domain-containing protein [Roseofilum casamattae]|uniref:IMS domain-containing protein n=1 Tax=Roseofilum casamattae BLCC-M143 TaxID=3022442 RepID=A0ABT7C113_9CYAN|nr:IMS domain-containing protein [Roseofilum casamattae]MDJ1185000.1 IMS domain-containing protein [Roseofilum casamattae BLCC-M143]